MGVLFGSILLNAFSAQEKNKPDPILPEVEILKLAPLSYPRLALQVRIAGEVEIKVEIRPDGNVASAVVVSGHPLLTEAALENARQSLFLCESCDEQTHSYRLTYEFRLGPTKYCTDAPDTQVGATTQAFPSLSQSKGHVVVADQPVGTCDLAGTVTYNKVRSAKCLYLWKCAKARVVFNY